MWYFADIPIIPENHAWFTAVMVFTCMAFTAILLRVVSRAVIVRQIGIDDWLMFLAMGISIAWLVCVIEQIELGLGDKVHFRVDKISDFLLWLFLTILFYSWGQWVIKVSILASYWRIFPTSQARRILKWILIWFGVYGVVNCLAPIFMCTPVNKFWNPNPLAPGFCTNYNVLHFVLSTFNVINDFIVLGFPIPFLYKLKLPLRIRIMLVITFTCGLFASIVSMMRFQALVINASGTPQEEPILGVQIIIWSGLEMNMAIVCGSVPSIKPLFKKLFPNFDLLSNAASSKKNAYNANPSGQSWASRGQNRHFQDGKHSSQGTYQDLEAGKDDGIWVKQAVELTSMPASDTSSERRLVPDYSPRKPGAGGRPIVIGGQQ